uniref:beta-N-acetylglucosaminidase domain-containing protein n=1 Tax=Collinsella sp. D33t1_170424_A12 TaxID=2787135 RepID=UPI001899CAA8
MNRTVSSNRTIWSFILCSLTLCVLTAFGAATPVWAAEGDYQIYPTPHAVTYAEGTQTLRKEANVVLEDGIDADTEARLNESLALKGMKAKKAKGLGGKRSTNILVGVKGSNGVVDKMVAELTKAGELTVADDLFSKTDAYLLASLPAKGDTPDRVIVLGASTDAAYYGLTTLYQILQQADGASLRAFTVADYADVITRGFIEGYYGNPWSTEDRVNLMKWGGYYKLNAYVYAPKDDPKHNAQWRTLYTEQELKEKIAPLAEAGNASKCRFVYALHPFMSNPITNANYDESVAILKKKFIQVMDNGVRQISILADDAGNQGNALYIKLCKEMTEWIREQQKATNEDGSLKYPGLKDTIIFCPVNYMGYGEGWYSQLPDNIQVVNTGGRVWGKIDGNFASAFQRNSGVAPFMWINWPCSDNDKDALHMGGHNNFLGSDVKPGQVKGVVLNPMQQSEPSKQGIFMNADFTWNLWKSEDHANQAWEDSFSYVDHNSPVATAGSNALKSLSGHALRMYGGGATWENGESAAIKDKLAAFRTKLSTGTVTEDDVTEMTQIFTELKKIAESYRAGAGNKAMLNQIVYWVDAMSEQSEAALLELEAVKADLKGDKSTLIAKYSEGTAKLDEANGHGYHYVNHTEYARIGKAHIV